MTTEFNENLIYYKYKGIKKPMMKGGKYLMVCRLCNFIGRRNSLYTAQTHWCKVAGRYITIFPVEEL